MKQTDRCCIDCTYFDKDGKECHKLPPRLYIKADGEYQETVTLWPNVGVTDWCGSFEAEQTEADIRKVKKSESFSTYWSRRGKSEIEADRKIACKLLTSVNIKDEDQPAIVVTFSLGEIERAVLVLKDALGKDKGIDSPIQFIKSALEQKWKVKKTAVTDYFQGSIDYLKSFGRKDK